MDKPTIGVRQADGSYYEIMDDAHQGRKRLVLSAARPDQQGVKIDLFRSEDGTLEGAAALGSIALDDPEGLGYKDIEFRVDLGDDDQLEASAALPGQAPRTLSVNLAAFRSAPPAPVLDTTDDPGDAFSLDPEPMTLDLPDLDEGEEAPRRSDSDILGDESLAGAELDTLAGFDEEPVEDLGELPDLGDEEAPRRSDSDILGDEALAGAELDTLDGFDDEPAAPDSFDLGDLDAGFGDEPAAAVPGPDEAVSPAEDWEKISLDDLEPMEFMDTGAEISAPKSMPAPSRGTEDPDLGDFSFGDDQPVELSDSNEGFDDLGDLGDFDAEPKATENDLDQDFLPPPELTDTPEWDADPEPAPMVTKPSKPGKPAKAPRAAKPARSAAAPRPTGSSAGLDKTALFLSLTALSLLVVLIIILLFLNMVKPPMAPVVQPEVRLWKPVATAPAGAMAAPQTVDLGSPEAPVFAAQTVLEVPQALRGAQVSLRLAPGDSAADAARRFGDPVRTQGTVLFW